MKVTAKGSGRISIAGLTCYRPGQRSRLIYRAMIHKGRKGEKKGFREPDFADLLDA
ncbi:IS630 family transposase, partial [Lentzea tibetensis]